MLYRGSVILFDAEKGKVGVDVNGRQRNLDAKAFFLFEEEPKDCIPRVESALADAALAGTVFVEYGGSPSDNDWKDAIAIIATDENLSYLNLEHIR